MAEDGRQLASNFFFTSSPLRFISGMTCCCHDWAYTTVTDLFWELSSFGSTEYTDGDFTVCCTYTLDLLGSYNIFWLSLFEYYFGVDGTW